MTDTMVRKTPAHLWVVGALSLLWNSFGGYDYTMTRFHNRAYLAQTGNPSAILAYIDAMPLWASLAWGIGVWGALLGSLLLIARSRLAVHAFGASLLGAIVSFAGQYLGPPMPGNSAAAAKVMPIVIILLAVAQLWYAMREAKAGVLR